MSGGKLTIWGPKILATADYLCTLRKNSKNVADVFVVSKMVIMAETDEDNVTCCS